MFYVLSPPSGPFEGIEFQLQVVMIVSVTVSAGEDFLQTE
jgi:hypothetical protein